jgi:hypothetical protein
MRYCSSQSQCGQEQTSLRDTALKNSWKLSKAGMRCRKRRHLPSQESTSARPIISLITETVRTKLECVYSKKKRYQPEVSEGMHDSGGQTQSKVEYDLESGCKQNLIEPFPNGNAHLVWFHLCAFISTVRLM